MPAPFLRRRGTQRASTGVAIFDNGLQFFGQHLEAGMHVFSDFAFDILELLLQTLLLSGRESLLRQRKQQKVLFPDMRGVQFGAAGADR